MISRLEIIISWLPILAAAVLPVFASWLPTREHWPCCSYKSVFVSTYFQRSVNVINDFTFRHLTLVIS